jgi:hypothetical protein
MLAFPQHVIDQKNSRVECMGLCANNVFCQIGGSCPIAAVRA